MSETKRVPLITFGGDKNDEKNQKCERKTVRLPIVLPESNESTCPVFNYKEELAAAKKKEKGKQQQLTNGKQTNGLDPFDEDDDDVRRIAQEMEAKYGMGPTAKKKRKGRKDDYADIGMGYDESDSFIDNTDGYDEMIPQNVTTLHGGFYINSGALEFKTDDEVSSEVSSSSSSSSSDEEEEEAVVGEKSSQKRPLSTSESEGETETDKTKEDKKVVNGIPPLKKKKLLSSKKIQQLKKNNNDENRTKTVKDLLKERREDGVNSSNDQKVPESKTTTTTTTNVVEDLTTDENKKPPNSMAAEIIEITPKGFDNNNKVSGLGEKKDTSNVVDNTSSTSPTQIIQLSEGENSHDSNAVSAMKAVVDVKLPENLPKEITIIINNIKELAAKNSENKTKQFPESINSLLLRLERKSRCLGKQSKSKIYQHLAPILNVRKETLLKRAKMLVLAEDTKRLKTLENELENKIKLAMPPLLEIYEIESQKVVQKRMMETDEKHVRLPKRKFVWTDESKKLLKEIVLIKRRCLLLEGKTKEQLDIQLQIYINSVIRSFWPDGWMTMAALSKMCSNFVEKKTPVKRPQEQQLQPPPLLLAATPPPQPRPKEKDLPKPVNKPDISSSTSAPKPKEKPLVNSQQSKPSKEQTQKMNAIKDIQKLGTLSITPVVPKTNDSNKHSKPPKSELTINMIDNNAPIELNALSISPVIPYEKQSPKSIIEEITVIKPIKTDALLKQKESPSKEKVTTFIHLPQGNYMSKMDNISLKPTKPPTDHKIENIIKPSNNAKPKQQHDTYTAARTKPDSIKPENLSKPKTTADSLKPQKVVEIMKTQDIIVLDDADVKPLTKHEHKVIDLTSSSSSQEVVRKKQSSSSKFYDPNIPKPSKSASSVDMPLVKTFTGNAALDSLLQESQRNDSDSPAFYSSKKGRSGSDNKELRTSSSSASNNNYNTKTHSEGDDIQKVMEDLKVLQKMSTPMKSSSAAAAAAAEALTSSPVSVIAFNKSYTPKTSNSSPMSLSLASTTQSKIEGKADYGLGFQEAFQRQFLSELKNTLAANQSSPSSSKNYNSSHSTSSSQPEKFFTNPNNNYASQNSNKYSNKYATQPQSTYNLMDDMLANFISEYAYPKTTANHKPKSQK